MYQVKAEVLQALLAYLAKQPYESVYQLIQAIQQSQLIVAANDEVRDDSINNEGAQETAE